MKPEITDNRYLTLLLISVLFTISNCMTLDRSKCTDNCFAESRKSSLDFEKNPSAMEIPRANPKTYAEKRKELKKEIVTLIMTHINEEEERRIRHNEVYPPLGTALYDDYEPIPNTYQISADY